MSATCIYSVYVLERDGAIVIRGVCCDTNISPKPKGRELGRSFARDMHVIPKDVDEIRSFLSNLSQNSSGGMYFESGERYRFPGPLVFWKRWRTRFMRGVGIDVGDAPPIGQLVYGDDISSGLPIGHEITETRHYRRGQIISHEEARELITPANGFSCNLQVEVLGGSVSDTDRNSLLIGSGRLGFLADGCVCVFFRNSRQRGFWVNSTNTIRVKTSGTCSRVAAPTPRAKPMPLRYGGEAECDGLYAILNAHGNVFCGIEDPAPRYSWQKIIDGYHSSFSPPEALKLSPSVALLMENEAKQAVAYYQKFNPDLGVRHIPAAEYFDLAAMEMLAA